MIARPFGELYVHKEMEVEGMTRWYCEDIERLVDPTLQDRVTPADPPGEAAVQFSNQKSIPLLGPPARSS